MPQFVLNYTLDNTSPLFNFGPRIGTAAGADQSGWQINASFATTSDVGATLQFPPFYGDAVSIYGSTGRPFDITIDKQTTSHSLASGVIFEWGVAQGTHNLSLTMVPSSSEEADAEFVFNYATISSAYTLDQAPVEVIYGVNSDPVVYSGNWSMFLNTTAQTNVFGASVSMNFSGVAIAVSGPSGTVSSAGSYAVVLDGSTSFISNNTVDISNTQLFYQGGLDPEKQHTITLVNSDSSFAFNSISVWGVDDEEPVTSSSGGSHTNIVEIVVPIVAVVAALLIVAGAFLFRRRRRQRQRRPTLTGPFAMRLSRSFAKPGSSALALNDLELKTERAVDGPYTASPDLEQLHKA
ncbi:hypothetical protein OBBRIDRAFT_839186 [Obba rivulosa]|uniref:Uncharacterized protein n=1 Tax=Obba rivulosa TaxID=1052685 RepID=A0A8E2ANN0_9APHY|nr:hypothetical protein OBBRIDRAFT_839186 [Obba rivulosa]